MYIVQQMLNNFNKRLKRRKAQETLFNSQPLNCCLPIEKSYKIFFLRTSKLLLTNQYLILTFKQCSCKDVTWYVDNYCDNKGIRHHLPVVNHPLRWMVEGRQAWTLGSQEPTWEIVRNPEKNIKIILVYLCKQQVLNTIVYQRSTQQI